MASQSAERRVVSVLIADVAGSTAIAEQLGPERSKFLLDEVVRLISTEVRDYEGTIAQLTGDGVLALFGAPVSHEDDAERAVRAALGVQRAIARYAGEVEAAYGIALAVRIGINTGPVVVSAPDDGGTDRYNALGDTVNVAARLQTVASDGGVVLGPATARLVEGCFAVEPIGARAFKGKRAPVEAFEVKGELQPSPAEEERPLVGRDFELVVLERTLDGLSEGRGFVAAVIGEPGIGKSRLAAEVCRRYRDRIRFLEGRAVSWAQAFPFWPVQDLLRGWLGVGASTPEARVRLELKAQLARLFGDEAGMAYPFLATVLGLALEPEAAEGMRELNRESVQRQTFWAVYQLAARLAEEQPVCLVLEDLHWADDSTLELVERLLAVTEEAAVGLLLLHRSEREHPSWRIGERARQRYPHRYKEIELRPLPADASRELAANLAGGELPAGVAELLADRAGGNPFFLEAALRDLVERGALSRQNGRFELTVGVETLAIPALVQGALQARLDRLDPPAREVVSVAAVIGRSFEAGLLTRILPRERLVPALSELQRLDLVVEERRRPSPEFRFRHGLVQEVAYASLLESKRRQLHGRVARALEEQHGASPEDAYTLLAHHFSEADEPEQAAGYLLAAGDRARALYADREALDHYRRARRFLARLGDDRRTRETLFKIALVHHLAFDFAEAEAAYDEAFCCRLVEEPRLEPSETLEIVYSRPDHLVPGDVYTSDGTSFTEQLFRGLLRVDRDMNVVPAMAENFRVSSDGRTYLFQLREGARWSDGVPLTADDFVYTWRRMREEGRPTAFLLQDVEGAEALDDRTLEVRMREPRNYFPYVLASVWSFPWPRHRCEELGEDWRRPENLVGNGPFVLAELREGEAVLRANPHWTGARGNVREIRVTFAASQADAMEAWRAGRFDVIPAVDPHASELPDTEVEPIPPMTTSYLGFRADVRPFDDVRVRRAFAHALDRERSVKRVGGLQRPARRGGAIPPALPGHSYGVGLEYDLELAQRLLAEAGYPEGRGLPPVEVVVPAWFESDIGEQWRALGATVTVTIVPRNDPWAVEDLIASGGQAWIAAWSTDYPDPDGFFRGLLEGQHWPFCHDAEVIELLARARSLHDQDERMRLYHEVDRLLVADRAAIVPIAYGRTLLLRRPWVEGIALNPLSLAQYEQVVVHRPAAAERRREEASSAATA